MKVRVQGNAEIQNEIYYEYDSESIPLGQGGMGIVYQGYCFNALNPSEFVPVAIKAIQNPTKNLVDRAMREASIQIDHPNLLRMYGFIPNMEFDEYSQTYKPKYYLIMERIVGVSLENLMKGVLIDKSGAYVDFAKELYDQYVNDRVAFVKRITVEVCQGLNALHAAGYVHRDVDPSNIMVTHDRKIKLIDFGVTKTIQAYNGPKLTQVGAIIGKPSYAAPEMVTGDITNHNCTTDVYSLGIMIYEMYTGTLPFQGDEAQIMHAQIHQLLPVTNINDTVIRTVVSKATSKNQTDRYADTRSLMEAILSEVQEKPGGQNGNTEPRKKPANGSSGNSGSTLAVILGCILGLSIGVGIYLLANL